MSYPFLKITMLQRVKFAICCLLLVLPLSACSRGTIAPSNTNAPPADSPSRTAFVTSLNFVKANASAAQIPAGGSGEAIVHLTVQQGYHVNANPPTYPYLKATALVAQSSEGLSATSVSYPNPMTKKFSFSDKPLAVYEGEVPIKLVLKATASATQGSHVLPAKLTVQACDNQVCYPPGTLDISIPVTVK